MKTDFFPEWKYIVEKQSKKWIFLLIFLIHLYFAGGKGGEIMKIIGSLALFTPKWKMNAENIFLSINWHL